MRKVICILSLVLVIFITGCYAQENAILVGWDGAQREHLKETMDRGELPNLSRLISQGAFVDMEVIGVTCTKPGFAQILTGCRPEVTGVIANDNYRPIPEGYTVFERLEKGLGKDEIETIMLAGKTHNLGAEGPAETGEPYFYTKDNIDLFKNGLGDAEGVGSYALECIENYKDKRFFLFIQFKDPDSRGHEYGENSRIYNEAIIECDSWLGRMMDKLEELGIYDKTLIYVTADHGFDEGEKVHSNAPYVFLATNDGQVIRGGNNIDIVPTILERLGISISDIEPPLDGYSLLREKP